MTTVLVANNVLLGIMPHVIGASGAKHVSAGVMDRAAADALGNMLVCWYEVGRVLDLAAKHNTWDSLVGTEKAKWKGLARDNLIDAMRNQLLFSILNTFI